MSFLKRLGDLGPLVMALVGIGGIAVAVAAIVWVLDLLPPKSLTMAAGRPDGGYYAIAERYRTILAEDGIELEILDTAGAVENASLLSGGKADVALIQGGVPIPQAEDFEALAAIFLEPLFIFHRADETRATDMASWKHLKVAAGEPGSGTRSALTTASTVLDIEIAPTALEPVGGHEAVQALLDGKVDLAVFVAPVDADYLQPLFNDPTIEISPVRDAEALTRRLSYVRIVDIPRSAIDYTRRIPAERLELIAMLATLVARDDLHPALVNRLVRAAERIHAGTSLVNADIAFPVADGVGLRMNVQAESELRTGPTAMERTLPYWVSAQVSWIAVLLLPLLFLIVPLVRMLPMLYDWFMHSRIYRAYAGLIAIDHAVARAESRDELDALMRRLDGIDRRAKAIRVPRRYHEYVYTFRLHIELVRRNIVDAMAAMDRETGGAAQDAGQNG